MLMLATRIGEGSKMVITGDLNQSDRVGLNGLQEICNKMRHNVAHSCIRFVALQCEDVQRSRAAKAILDIYESTSPAGKKEDAVSEFGAAASFAEDKNIVEQDSSIRGLTTERSQVKNSNIRGLTTERSQVENSSILENSSESIIVEIVEESVPIDAEAPTKDNACTPKNSCRSPKEEKEWININSDAALIPLNHLTRKYRGE